LHVRSLARSITAALSAPAFRPRLLQASVRTIGAQDSATLRPPSAPWSR